MRCAMADAMHHYPIFVVELLPPIAALTLVLASVLGDTDTALYRMTVSVTAYYVGPHGLTAVKNGVNVIEKVLNIRAI